MDVAEIVLVLAAGFGAGILSSSVGVASLLSFPILLAVGLPPVVANTTNTIGLIPAGAGGVLGYRQELRQVRGLAVRVVVLTGLAGSIGAALLLGLPSSVFEWVAPWLILGTCLLVGVQPRISRWLAARHPEGEDRSARVRLSPLTTAFVVLTGVYGGYFGAGAGVMMIAVLALGLDIDLRIIGALRTTSVMASNVVAGAVFVVVADIDWTVVALLAVSSIFGGYVGARIARRMPASPLRAGVVAAGIVAAITLWT
ncbi:permease [Aeromicrobium sp. PE09-221]|uniref:sulfite exporter TauE/SafE family protein n=1 Tax=Aeromicrobium sp. PE09-221 TaxID=1898043 RepID=UPI000B3E683C|nr:sulfite exporter TauE/SafE family protein [Aeromicrobium sp. PE09-221]OUZ08924.1 permease [Aeromicrobium sp. PE09-221]